MATSTVDDLQISAPATGRCASSRIFAIAATSVAVMSCLLAGWTPLGFSIVTVFLFRRPA